MIVAVSLQVSAREISVTSTYHANQIKSSLPLITYSEIVSISQILVVSMQLSFESFAEDWKGRLDGFFVESK